jgi:hypothetical protein
MGSGDKFKIGWMHGFGFGLGVHVDRFPHQLSINIILLKVSIYIGFGKGYDE